MKIDAQPIPQQPLERVGQSNGWRRRRRRLLPARASVRPPGPCEICVCKVVGWWCRRCRAAAAMLRDLSPPPSLSLFQRWNRAGRLQGSLDTSPCKCLVPLRRSAHTGRSPPPAVGGWREIRRLGGRTSVPRSVKTFERMLCAFLSPARELAKSR